MSITRQFGIEIEFICSQRIADKIESLLSPGWNLSVEDSDSNIYEIISPPLRLDSDYGEIYRIFSLLQIYQSEGLVEFDSKNCGTHVHVDVYDLSLDEIKSIIYNYNKHENQFFEIVSPFRRDNWWCLSHNKFEEQDLDAMDSMGQLANFIQGCHKCYGLNLYSYAKFKTLEFRLLEASDNFNKFILWINTLQYRLFQK